MRASVLRTVSVSWAMLISVSILSTAKVTQTPAAEADTAAKTAPIYDPYPPGILPSELNSELACFA